MSDFKLHILGCGSASPSKRHNPSCQVVDYRGTLMMIDCGEGSQIQMRRMGLSFARLRHIFISHLHGDHFLGLPGLLASMSLHDMAGDVHVYIFKEGADLLRRTMEVTMHAPACNIVIHEIRRERAVLLDTPALTVESFPLYHSGAAVGFIIKEKPKQPHLRGDMLEYHQVPTYRRAALKLGEDFVKPDGTVVPNAVFTLPPGPSLSYAYCSDTVASPRVAEAVRGVTTLYHEATYGDDKTRQAHDRGHSTARQAAEVAKAAGAGRLVIGHFSQSYRTDDELLAQAREVFPNTIAANEGMTIDLTTTAI